ncbi:enterochelin esterase [Marinicauda salina]|uniref:Enterochelin esterase n=1 Tax=Marinicauda salina TaxID=2135793 RepID=A0A2U2BXN9_9PROT|nr:alpha/beta hydrolase-fold protein [Marinicauda salina]PWE18776.1 enterochelin esterase [Marinicauda salina]
MTARHDHPKGALTRIEIDSNAVAGNLLGDSPRRAVDVYVPAGHDGAGLPLLIDLAGFTGSGLGRTAWKNFGENVPERLDRLIGDGAMPPVVVAFPDGFTRLGGNQYINSPVFGDWTDFLADELAPEIESRFACGGEGKRGLYGKSSGGYGALVNAMLRPETWAAAGCMSGDAGFDVAHGSDFPKALRALDRAGGVEAFIAGFEAAPKPKGEDIHVLMILAMAASYDPDPDSYLGIRLPVTPDTCERIPDRWANWMAWDPAEMVRTRGEALKGLKALHIECGDRDQYDLLYGQRRIHKRLEDLGVPHRYEEFPDDHSSLDYRLDRVLPFLAEGLAG